MQMTHFLSASLSGNFRVQLPTWIVGPVLLLGRGVLTGGLSLFDFQMYCYIFSYFSNILIKYVINDRVLSLYFINDCVFLMCFTFSLPQKLLFVL